MLVFFKLKKHFKACLGFCILHRFKMSLVHIALAFTFQVASQSMSKVLTHIPTSSPKLASLFCFCRRPPLLCYTLVLSLLFLGVGFNLNLISFWGCLKLILCALVCFIGPFEPFKMRLENLFVYPLTKSLEI